MIECYVGLGSNIGSPKKTIIEAIKQLSTLHQSNLSAVSSLYRTPAWGMISQPDFINACVKLSTDLGPQEMLKALLALEKSHGRVRAIQWGPRTLDCDLLLYGNEIIHEPNLTVPHPRMTERAFVLLPLEEIAPQLILNQKSINTWISYCDLSRIEKLSLSKEEMTIYDI